MYELVAIDVNTVAGSASAFKGLGYLTMSLTREKARVSCIGENDRLGASFLKEMRFKEMRI